VVGDPGQPTASHQRHALRGRPGDRTYHRSLQEEFFDAYIVTGTERHILRRGDTIWELATREYRVPVWLLRQYNPDLDFGALPAGVAMLVPVIEPRND
jgi:membrane-bound lytic murein transglycosylase D